MKKLFCRSRSTPAKPCVDWKTDNRVLVMLAVVLVFGPRVADIVQNERGSDADASPHPNLVLASTANRAIRSKNFTAIPGYCQKFERQVVQDKTAYGDYAYQSYMKGTARLTGLAFLRTRYGFPASELEARGGLQVGDILFKTTGSGGAGHVGIYVGRVPGYEKLGGLVAENSSTSIRRIQGAKGYRTLREFGAVNVYVRLPVITKEVQKPSQ